MEFACSECGKKFGSEEAKDQHFAAKHAVEKPKRKLNIKKTAIAAAAVILAALLIISGINFASTTPYTVQRDRGNIFGPENATVTFTEYSDFECPFCGQAEPTVKQLMDKYGGRVRFVYKHYPLRQIHSTAQKAAEASECAADQGKFWEMHDILFANQRSLFVNSLKDYAKRLGLNATAFNSCLDSNAMAFRVDEDISDGDARTVSSTPTFFVNERKIQGTKSISEFESVIEAELR